MTPQQRDRYDGAIRAVPAHAASAPRTGLDPEVVAAVIERAVTTRRPRTRYLVGREAKVAARPGASSRTASWTPWSPAGRVGAGRRVDS
jgi:hypothetical protein